MLACLPVRETKRCESGAPPGPGSPGIYQEDGTLARPNYQHEKRQKDIAKKKKAEEKKLRKAEKKNSPSDENGNPIPGEGETPS